MFKHAMEDFKADVLARYPEEACGIISGDQYIPMENVADDPRVEFSIPQSEINYYIRDNSLQAVLHSHPSEVVAERSCPSAADMRGQMQTAVPWGIVDTDGEMVTEPYWIHEATLDEPLIGCQFHHGVNDCYSAIRKWYWQNRGVKLVEIPRDVMWWKNDDDLYVNYYERAGFSKVDASDLRDGDIIFGSVESANVNHAGVYLDNSVDGKGLIYHHLPGRLSRREPAGPWVRRSAFIARYDAS